MQLIRSIGSLSLEKLAEYLPTISPTKKPSFINTKRKYYPKSHINEILPIQNRKADSKPVAKSSISLPGEKNKIQRERLPFSRQNKGKEEKASQIIRISDMQPPNSRFHDLVYPELATLLFELKGIETPTSIQYLLLNKFTNCQKDLLVKAETGSGKTFGYVLAILSHLKSFSDENYKSVSYSPKVMVLTPNKILSEQIVSWFRELNPQTSISTEVADKPTILMGSGRSEKLRIMMASGQLALKPSLIVVDETDALLKPLRNYATAKELQCRMKHPNPIIALLKDVRQTFNPECRIIYVSATLNCRTKKDLNSAGLLKNGALYLDPNHRNTYDEKVSCPKTISHFHHFITEEDAEAFQDKMTSTIEKIAHKEALAAGKLNGLLFLPSQQSKSDFMRILQERTFNRIPCHYLSDGRQGLSNALLVASHSDSRGLDLPEAQFVIILGVPETPSVYLHCAGRVGRMGRAGNVYSILGPNANDLHRFTAIERYLNIQSQLLFPRMN